VPFQGQPATASERKWNDGWWGYLKRREPLPPEKQIVVAKQKQQAAKAVEEHDLEKQKKQLRFIIMKRARAFEGATAEWAYRGSTCKKADVPPGKVYLDFDAAQADAERLTDYNPVGNAFRFVVLPLLPEEASEPV
jgi:hypothetical protein